MVSMCTLKLFWKMLGIARIKGCSPSQRSVPAITLQSPTNLLPPPALFQQVFHLEYTHKSCLQHLRTNNRCPQQQALKTTFWASTFLHYFKHINWNIKKMKSHYYIFKSKDNVRGTGLRLRIWCGCGQSVSVVLRAEQCSLAVTSRRCHQLLQGWRCRSMLLLIQKVTKLIKA